MSDPSAIFGLFDSGGSSIAEGKQAMISEAIDKQFAAEAAHRWRRHAGRCRFEVRGR